MMHSDASQPCPCGSGLLRRNCCDAEAQVRTVLKPDGLPDGEPLTSEVTAALASVGTSPDLFPVHIDFAQQRLRLVKMSQRWYRESVFLDPSRILGRYAVDVSFAAFERWMTADSPQAAVFIFHTAFCGSTLMSQLLDALYETLPLREPEALGNLLAYLRAPQVPEQHKRATFGPVMQLLARRYEPTQIAIIKANDYCNPMAREILQRDSRAPLLFMYVPLEEFVVACLRVPARCAWIRQRCNAVRAMAPQHLPEAQELVLAHDAFSEMAAFYWAYNISLYRQAYGVSPERLRCLDFNALLADPLRLVHACARHFDLAPRVGVNADEVLTRLLGVYSKNSHYSYSPAKRLKDIAELRQRYAAQIDGARIVVARLLGDTASSESLPGALRP